MAHRKELRIGIFVVLVVIASFVVINILRGVDIFGREYTYTARFKDVESLVASAPVYIKGYSAGRVSSVEYEPDNDCFVVECSVDRRFRIPSDSQMTLYSTSIMGGKGIRIDYGTSEDIASDGAELLPGTDGDLVSSLSDGIGPLLEKLASLSDSLSNAVGSVNAVLDERNRENIAVAAAHLSSTLASASELAGELRGKSEELGNLIVNLSSLSDRVSPIADSVHAVVGNVSRITEQIAGAGLGETVGKMDETLDGINAIVDNINLPLAKILDDADSLISEIKNNPKKYIKITVF